LLPVSQSGMLLSLGNLIATVSCNSVSACHQRTCFLIRDENTRLPICAACLLRTYAGVTVLKRILGIIGHSSKDTSKTVSKQLAKYFTQTRKSEFNVK